MIGECVTVSVTECIVPSFDSGHIIARCEQLQKNAMASFLDDVSTYMYMYMYMYTYVYIYAELYHIIIQNIYI